jgi:hypothetical protein
MRLPGSLDARDLVILIAGLTLAAGCAASGSANMEQALLDPRFQIGDVLHSDDFRQGDANWLAELQSGGRVEVRDGLLEIDVPAGCTVWFKPRIEGPVLIEYEATVISAGGPNDRVSDLNCFWMATDSRSPDGEIFKTHRSGKFEDYHQLRCYYVGLGGNTNTTTRFRRYIGSPTNRPLLPEHDLTEPQFLIAPNQPQKIQLVACGQLIQYYRDGLKIFELTDSEPYTAGWFALRTVSNHMQIRNFRVMRLDQREVR